MWSSKYARAPRSCAARLVHAGEVHAVAGHHVLEALAVAIAQVAHLVHLERACARRRSEQAAPEAGTLLVGPVHEAHAHGRLSVLAVRAQDLERAELAKRAVEPSAVRHGVDVRADDHEPILLARKVGPEIAGRVHRDLHGQLV